MATTQVASIGAAVDRGKTQDPVWKAIIARYQPAREWLAQHTPATAIVIYNDHANGVDLDIVPTFAIGTAERYRVADEGFGRRPVPDVIGNPELSLHLLKSLVDDGFDLTVFQELDVDHGLTVPLSIYCPDPGEAWPCQVVPLLVNVIQYPQPTAARCYALGQAIGRAIESFESDARIAIFGTGGMSHQLAGSRAGYINPKFDEMFLEAIETDPGSLA